MKEIGIILLDSHLTNISGPEIFCKLRKKEGNIYIYINIYRGKEEKRRE